MKAALAVEKLRAALAGARLGQRVVYVPVATSTMDVLRQEAEGAAPEGTVVVAEEQTAGRGRFGRRWFSTPGQDLAFSVLLYPTGAGCAVLGIAAAVALIRAVRQVTGLSPSLKWPNDLLVEGKKVAGILVESAWEGTHLRYAIVGIGINVNSDPSGYPELASATSLAAQVGRPVHREELLLAMLKGLEETYQSLAGWSGIWEEWRAALETLGHEVRLQWGDQVEEGMAEGVNSEGNLLLRRADGSLASFAAGEVTLAGTPEPPG